MPSPTPAEVKVWDPLIWIVHWSTVTGVSVAWLFTEGRIHDAAGYAVLGLMTLRILWRFVGPWHARFANFVANPRTVLEYARLLCSKQKPRHIGHNPLGGWMIIVLLATGITTSLSGWLYTTDSFWGIEWVERIHALFAYLLLVLIALHVFGVTFTSIRQRENLVAAMFHGRKRTEAANKSGGPR